MNIIHNGVYRPTDTVKSWLTRAQEIGTENRLTPQGSLEPQKSINLKDSSKKKKKSHRPNRFTRNHGYNIEPTTSANDPATRTNHASVSLTHPALSSLAIVGSAEEVVELVGGANVTVEGLEDDALPGVLVAAPRLLARALVTLAVGVVGIYDVDDDDDGDGTASEVDVVVVVEASLVAVI